MVPPFIVTSGTIDAKKYLEILEKTFTVVPILKQHHLCSRTIYQQDGAPPHIHKKVSEFLQMNFRDNVLSRCLTRVDFWYWGE